MVETRVSSACEDLNSEAQNCFTNSPICTFDGMPESFMSSSSSARAKSSVVAKRRSGLDESALSTTVSSEGGTSSRSGASGLMAGFAMATTISVSVPRGTKGRLASSSQSTMASAYWSARWSTFSPRACSGAM